MGIFKKIKRWLTTPSSKGVDPKNFTYVQIDGVGVGIANAAAPFLPVFLTRLGAEALHIGLLSSMPGIAGLITAIPLGRFLQTRRNIIPWFSRARVMVILSYALTGLVTFLFGSNTAILLILIIWALASIPQTIVGISFGVVMNSVAGPSGRFELMSRRWSILGLTSAVCAFLIGLMLERIVFPLNYQLAFYTLSIGAFISYYYSSHIVVPDFVPRVQKHTSLKSQYVEYWQLVSEQPAFLNFVFKRSLFNFGLYFVIPLLPLYYVRVVNASDQWIAIITTVQMAVLLFGYFFWSRQSRRISKKKILILTTFVVGLFPIATAATQLPWLIAIFAAIAGIFNAGINLVFFDELMQRIPEETSASFVAVSQSFEYLVALTAPLLSTLLANQIGLTITLLIGGGLRIAGSLSFLLKDPPFGSTEHVSDSEPKNITVNDTKEPIKATTLVQLPAPTNGADIVSSKQPENTESADMNSNSVTESEDNE